MRAISPVIATLLMIAIAVAASLVAYAWVMGYMGFTTSKVDKAIMIQSVTTDGVYVQNVGDSLVWVTGIYVNGVADDLSLNQEIDKAETIYFEFAKKADYATLTRMTVKVVCNDGTMTEFVKTNPGAGGGGGGGGGTVTPPTVTRVQNSLGSFTTAPTQGDLLVVMVGNRDQATDSYVDPIMTGWTLAEVARFKTASSTSDRRAIAIFYKVAGASEGTAIPDVNWGTSGGSNSFKLAQAFTGATTWTEIASGPNNGAATSGISLTVPSTALPSGTTANVLSIAGMVWRNDPPTITGIGFSGLTASNTAGTTQPFGTSAYNYGLPVTQTTVTWTNNHYGSGALVQFSCTA
jgi:archaeal type IV pilus assembly protein PilA